MNHWLVLPILIPLLTAAASFLLYPWRGAQRACGLIGAAGLLVSALRILQMVCEQGVQTSQMGGWIAPFGITLVADLLSAPLLAVTGLIGFAVALYSLADVDNAREAFQYYSLLNLLLAGICGAFLTGDMFNLYVWFEVTLMASFVLLALGGERRQLRAALVYVTTNLVSSAFFLGAVGILYGLTGTLNMADLALRIDQAEERGLVLALAMVFLVAFGIKAAVFPFFFWLPASYHTPPVAVSAVFAGLLTEVGVYALSRVFTLLFTQEPGFTHSLILALAGLTMLVGTLGAVAQREVRRMLSFLIIAHVGVMLLGLGLNSAAGLAGMVFYMVHHTIAQANIFLVCGLACRWSGTGELERMGGLYESHPQLAALFAVPALALCAFPPFSGFFPTVSLLRAGLELEQYALTGALLFTDFLTLYVMARIWSEVFWKPAPAKARRPDRPTEALSEADGGRVWPFLAPLTLLGVATVGLSAAAGSVVSLAGRAAGQLLDRAQYLQAVLGGVSP